MDAKDAARAVAEVDEREAPYRAARLVELNAMLPTAEVGFSGQAAQWLFEDVKATWIYGYFTATVLAAVGFCLQQVAGSIRMLADGTELPTESTSLDQVSALAHGHGLISVDLRAKLLTLHDLGSLYLNVGLHGRLAGVERHIVEADRYAGEHALLSDARSALACSVALLHRRS